MLKISVNIINDLAVIECDGIVQRSQEESLNRHMKDCVKKGAKSILFDWTDVTYFDSMGLESLITVYKSAQEYPDVKLGILITDPILANVYKTLKFQKILPLFTEFNEAVAFLQSQLKTVNT